VYFLSSFLLACRTSFFVFFFVSLFSMIVRNTSPDIYFSVRRNVFARSTMMEQFKDRLDVLLPYFLFSLRGCAFLGACCQEYAMCSVFLS